MKKALALLLAAALLLASGTSVLAESGQEEEERRELTLEESVERAIRNSFQIRRAAAESEKAYIVRQQAVEDRDAMDPIIPTLDYLAALNVAQKDIQWRMSRREIELIEDRMAYETRRMYYNVLREETAKEIAGLALERAEKMAERAEIMYRAGVISGLELERARHERERALADLHAREQEVEGAYEQFNRLVGLSLQERPLLVDVPEWELLRDIGVGLYVSRAMDNNLAIWLAEQQIELAEYDKKLHRHYELGDVVTDPMSAPEPYEAKEINVQMARYDYYDTRRQLELNTRNIYRTIRMLEHEYARLENAEAELESELNAQQARLEAGLVTRYDLMELEDAEEQLKLQRKDLLLEHEMLKFVIRKPWVLDGAPR